MHRPDVEAGGTSSFSKKNPFSSGDVCACTAIAPRCILILSFDKDTRRTSLKKKIYLTQS